MKKNIWLLAVGIGIANAVVLYIFEFIGVDVTNWLWNDVFATDEYRWRVLPVALGLGLLLTATIKFLRDKRVVPVQTDLLAEVSGAPSTLYSIGVVLTIGAMCLLAGGSIGPEASLMLASAGIGAYASHRWKFNPLKQPIILASIGALLVAFLGSLVLALVPILVLFQQAKQQKRRVPIKVIAISIVASLASFLTIQAINRMTGDSGGYGTAPPMPAFQMKDFVIAGLLGFVSGFLGLCLNWCIARFWQFATWLDSQKLPTHDWLIGLLFSGVLGIVYLLGGQTIQFSGSIGSGLLVSDASRYSILALGGLIVTKILATAWSKGTGYRGGLVFPSIYIGVALGLLAGSIADGLSGAGALVGGIAGMIAVSVGSPVIAGVFLAAILPWRLWPVGLCAVVGTLLFSKLTQRRIATAPLK